MLEILQIDNIICVMKIALYNNIHKDNKKLKFATSWK